MGLNTYPVTDPTTNHMVYNVQKRPNSYELAKQKKQLRH